MKKIIKRIKLFSKSFCNWLNNGYDYNPKYNSFEWEEIQMPLGMPPEHIVNAMVNYPGENITTYEKNYIIRGIWIGEKKNISRVSTLSYKWYKKKMTEEEKKKIDKNSK